MTCNNLYLLPKGKKKDAEAALIAAETPRSAPVEVVASTSKPTDPVMHESTSSTKRGQLGRPRKKKSFGDDFVHEQNQGQWLANDVPVFVRRSKLLLFYPSVVNEVK